jgi:hypothetical protein
MIKRTLHFGNPAYLSLKDDQLMIDLRTSKHWVKRNPKNVWPLKISALSY